MKAKNIIMLTIAGVINAAGICLFLSPAGLYDGGISGTSMLLSNLTNLPLALFLLLLNTPLFLFGLKSQGKIFTIYSLFAVAIYSISTYLYNQFSTIGNVSPIVGNDIFLCSIFGGLISGIGSGIVIRFGGAIDGIEVMSVIFAKRIGLTVGSFVMLYNVIIYSIAAIINHSWILSLYSVISYYVGLKTIDFIVEGIDRSKSAIIITTKADDICKALSDEFKCGITLTEAKGYYSNSSKTMIYFVINRFQISKMRNIVKEIDPDAYISINEVSDLFKN